MLVLVDSPFSEACTYLPGKKIRLQGIGGMIPTKSLKVISAQEYGVCTGCRAFQIGGGRGN